MALLDMMTERNTADSSTKQPAIATDANNGVMEDAFVSTSTSQKLDADLYSAIDTGDGADGLSGSGNLNFLTLQAQQNDLLGNSLFSTDNTQGQEVTLGGLGSALASKSLPTASGLFYTGGPSGSGDGSAENITAPQQMTVSNLATNPTTAAPSINNSDNMLSTDGAIGTALSGLDGNSGMGRDGQSGINGLIGPQGISGINGINGADGRDGQNGGGDGCCGPNIDIDILNISDLTLVNITNLGDVISLNPVITTITTIINPLLPLLGGDGQAPGDTDLLIDLDLSDALNLGGLPVVGNVIGDLTTVLPVVGSVLGTVDGLLTQNTHVILDPVESIIGDIDIDLGALGQSLLEGGSLTLGLEGVLGTSALPPLDVTIPLPDTIGLVEDILADPTAAIEGALEGLGGLLADGDQTGDSDLVVGDALGIGEIPLVDSLLTQNVHITLDPVEAITCDIDLNLAAAASDLLDGGSLDASLDGLLLGETLEALDLYLTTPDTGSVIEDILHADVAAALDTLTEPLTSDPHETLGSLLDGGDLGSVLGDATALWPETPVESIVENTIDSVLGASSCDGLIAPVGSVAEGLGLLDGLGGISGGSASGGNTTSGGLLGGLFG